MSTNTQPVAANDVAPYGHTANDRPVPGGFTGTVAGFLEWLKCHLAYSRIRFSETEPGRFGSGMIRRVELVTAGYSDDENLLGRVSKSLFATCYWESTHHGGLTVYGVPVEHMAPPEIQTWLEPPIEVFQEIHRVRELVVHTPQGDEYSVELPGGARLSFSEHEHDTLAPAGVLTIDPIDPAELDELAGPTH